MTSRLGLFGGTFDPVHVGHLVVAQEVRHALALDKVLLVVANEPWQKMGQPDLTPAEERFAVTSAAVDGIEGLEASRLELDRGGPSYTVDTVREIGVSDPGAEVFLIVGADVAAEIGSWERVDELADLVKLVIVDRPSALAAEDPSGFDVLRVRSPSLDVSSSNLRRRLREGRPVRFLVPDAAIRCIRERGMYSGGR